MSSTKTSPGNGEERERQVLRTAIIDQKMKNYYKEKKEEEEKDKKPHNLKTIRYSSKEDKDLIEEDGQMEAEMALICKWMGAKAIKREADMNRDNVFVLQTEVKSGTYSKIYKAKHGDNEALVCKVVLLDKTPLEYRTNLLDMGLKIQRFVGWPAITGVVGAAAAAGGPIAGAGRHPILMRVDDIYATDKKVFIFQSETDPKSIVDKFKKMATVDEAEAKKTLKKVGECVQYLHSVGVAHLNLRTSSVVQDKTTGVKVVGMDGCTFYWDRKNEVVLSRKPLPTSEFDKQPHLPPEAFKGGKWYGPSADVWSFGALMCEVLAKDPPYKLSDKRTAEKQWKAFSEGKAFSNEAKRLLGRIFVEQQWERPSISDVLNDTYFRNVA